MNAKKLEFNYRKDKDDFHKYIDNIKRNMKIDIYSIINTTLIKNPYTTKFPVKYFSHSYNIENRFVLFLKSSIRFYLKQLYIYILYFISFLVFKIYYVKKKNISTNSIAIDVFLLVNNINKENRFNENYLAGLYDILDKYDKNFVFFPRLYGSNKNPFKIIKLLKILNDDKRKFLFEFELLSFKDFIKLFFMILVYPFKTLRLLQKEKSDKDILFNNELIRDISSFGFDAFSRYIYGKNIAKFDNITKIYAWSEFQVVERSFNFGIKTNNNFIKLYGCQFYLYGEAYFNVVVDDIDFIQKTAFDVVLVNGKAYIKDRKFVKYLNGVSLRYKNLFVFTKNYTQSSIVLLGSYMENETKLMLEYVSFFDKILFKNHPAVNINKFGTFEKNIDVVNDNVYELFKNAKVVISTESGTLVEAVSCGISVIVIASQENLTANPLVDYGKGKIWDIAFSQDDVKIVYNKLIEYRKNNVDEIKNIASLYKDNFFIEPTEENIVKAFELESK